MHKPDGFSVLIIKIIRFGVVIVDQRIQGMKRLFGEIYSKYGQVFPVGLIYEKGYFSRPFGQRMKKLVMLYCPGNPVAFSQIYPFFFYEKQIEEQFGISIRALPVDQYASDLVSKADVIGVQTDFSADSEYIEKLFAEIRRRNTEAKMVYLDWCAPLDLRLAGKVNPYVDLYIKRQVFRDHRRYLSSTLGDTNLVDYYSRLFNLVDREQHFAIPSEFFSKVLLGPGLLTGPYLLNAFADRRNFSKEKTIGVHARFSCSGTPWYSAMRNSALEACRTLRSGDVVYGNGVPRKEFLNELAQSKMCFSPFGYGEVCWRDYEAALYGSLLLKPDMDHLKTSPDIFVKNETYVPIAWDYSDLREKVEFYANDERERKRIVENARHALDTYVNQDGFIRQMAPVFQLAHGAAVQKDWNLAYSSETLNIGERKRERELEEAV